MNDDYISIKCQARESGKGEFSGSWSGLVLAFSTGRPGQKVTQKDLIFNRKAVHIHSFIAVFVHKSADAWNMNGEFEVVGFFNGEARLASWLSCEFVSLVRWYEGGK